MELHENDRGHGHVRALLGSHHANDRGLLFCEYVESLDHYEREF
jgi:hypothetical protein